MIPKGFSRFRKDNFMGDPKKDSILWSKKFIPVYFIAALLLFLLFKFYIKTDINSISILLLFLVGLGIASIVYNSKGRSNNSNQQ